MPRDMSDLVIRLRFWCETCGQTDCGAAADEIERLRAALKPFAQIADDYDDREDNSLKLMVDADQIRLTVGDVRAARAALYNPQSES